MSDFQHFASRQEQHACSQASAGAALGVANMGAAGEVREERVRGDASEIPTVRCCQDRKHLQSS